MNIVRFKIEDKFYEATYSLVKHHPDTEIKVTASDEDVLPFTGEYFEVLISPAPANTCTWRYSDQNTVQSNSIQDDIVSTITKQENLP